MKNYQLYHVAYTFDIESQIEAPVLHGWFATMTNGEQQEQWQWVFSNAYSGMFKSRRLAMNSFKECELFGDLFSANPLSGCISTDDGMYPTTKL